MPAAEHIGKFISDMVLVCMIMSYKVYVHKFPTKTILPSVAVVPYFRWRAKFLNSNVAKKTIFKKNQTKNTFQTTSFLL